MIKIALLVPCFNAERHFETFIQHINSIRNDFSEIIFYDDKSADNTLELLAKSGYKYIQGETNKGPGYARNRLAEAAQSEYIHFHDIDDAFNPHFLSIILPVIKEHTPDVVVGNADWIDAKTRDTLIAWRYSDSMLQKDPLEYLIAHPLGIINTVYKRSSFFEVNGFNETLNCWEDSDLHIRMAAEKMQFRSVNEVVAYSIRHNTGISKNQDWCWECRLEYLLHYLKAFSSEYKIVILQQISKCALEFYLSKNWLHFNKAVEICKINKFKLPVSNNPIINILISLHFNTKYLYDLQRLFRYLKK